jgi:hypothetical protein
VTGDELHTALPDDSRWRRLQDREVTCPTCGGVHRGVFDLACGKPDPFPETDAYSPNAAVLTSSRFLSEDFCVLDGEQHFVRCILQLPIVGAADERFAYGVWARLAKADFVRYTESFDQGQQGGLGPWPGWLSNRLVGYLDSLGLTCRVQPRNGRQRPTVALQPGDHPLVAEQRDGITFDRLLEIYAVNGHDLRRALTD